MTTSNSQSNSIETGGSGTAPPSPAVTREELDRIFLESRTWGRWGPDDERGALNHMTPQRIVAATHLVQTGRCISLALPIDTVGGPANKKPALHYMSQFADRDPGEPSANMDYVGVDYHGKATTHIDALCHMVYAGTMYNGRSQEVVTSAGSSFGSVTAAADGIVGRGVLLDMPRLKHVPWLEPGTPIYRSDLEAAEQAEDLVVGPGDIVVIRTGHYALRQAVGAWDASNLSSGLHVSAVPWLRERDIAVLGSDGDNDLRPSPISGVHSPIHALAIVGLGVLLLDNLDLEVLARECAQESRWEFLLTVAPLRIPGGTGSPINPVAVL